jgi:hypothetical protein
MRSIALSMLACLAIFSACSGEEPERPAAEESVEIPFRQDGMLTFLRGGDAITSIAIEIAESDSARQRGLMQRTSLPENSGMLFIFNREEVQSFWMANTPLSLDIMYVNADSQIVDIAKYTRPFSPSSITSEAPARYVIEVPAGYSDTHGITESDRVAWRRL